MTPREIRLPARDGRLLSGRVFSPIGAVRASLVVAPAMGVSQGFYAPLARWLAGQGVVVLTFDYRGVGRSRVEPLAEEPADLMTWAEQDLAGALEVGRALAPGRPAAALGHSFGGQVLPLVPGATSLGWVVTVAAGSGWWRLSAPPLRRRIRLFWGVVVPVGTWWCGYFPGKRLRLVGDLPAGAILQWRAWCQHRDYLFGHWPQAAALYADFPAPVCAISFADDELLDVAAIDELARRLPADRLTRLRYPASRGERWGHFGAFREGAGERLWSAWFDGWLSRLPPGDPLSR